MWVPEKTIGVGEREAAEPKDVGLRQRGVTGETKDMCPSRGPKHVDGRSGGAAKVKTLGLAAEMGIIASSVERWAHKSEQDQSKRCCLQDRLRELQSAFLKR